MEPLTKEIIGLLGLVLILAIWLSFSLASLKREQSAHLNTKKVNREQREEEARQRQADEDRERESEDEEEQQREHLHLLIKENKKGRSQVYLENRNTKTSKPNTLLFSPQTYEKPEEAAAVATRIQQAKLVIDIDT